MKGVGGRGGRAKGRVGLRAAQRDDLAVAEAHPIKDAAEVRRGRGRAVAEGGLGVGEVALTRSLGEVRRGVRKGG